MKHWLRIQQLRGERGSTLIEMCVVIAIMGVMAAASGTWISGMFNSQARAQVGDDQMAESNRTIDYLESNLDDVAVGNCGLTEQNSSKIEETSLAGDQVVCHDDMKCWRYMYLARTKQVKVAIAISGTGDCSTIRPKRGPNQLVNGSYTISNSGDSLYDPVLDSPNSLPLGSTVFTLADDVVLTQNGSTDTSAYPLFSYWDAAETAITPAPDNQANSASSNGLYATPINLARINSILISGYVDVQLGIGATVAPRAIDQKFYLN